LFQFEFSFKTPRLALSKESFCRKIKLKNFCDPKPAGGCGVVQILSLGDFLSIDATSNNMGLFMLALKFIDQSLIINN
jgi:hypothetical protein